MERNPKTKAEIALEVFAECFAGTQRVTIAEVVEAARLRGVSRQTLNCTARELDLRTILRCRDGGIWVLPRA